MSGIAPSAAEDRGGQAIAALGILRETARTQLAASIHPGPGARARRGVRSALVRSGLRPASAEGFGSWPGGLLASALAESHRVTNDDRDFDAVRDYAAWWMRRHHTRPLRNADYLANGRVVLWLYEKTGDTAFLDEARRMERYLREHPRSQSGLIPYRSIAPNQIYIDSIGLLAPFVTDYTRFAVDDFLRVAMIRQADAFFRRALDSRSGLPYHAFDDASGSKLGAAGWGRGVGWLLFGVGELLRSDRATAEANPSLVRSFLDLCDQVCELQTPQGSFSWLLPAMDGPADASAAGLIHCGLWSAGQLGAIDSPTRTLALSRSLASIVSSHLEGGDTDLASAECGGLGIYPQSYGHYPWAVAPHLMAISRYLGPATAPGSVGPRGG